MGAGPNAANRTARVCVLGLGYIGLPTASMLAVAGYDVLGVDPSPQVQAALSAGQAHIEEPDLARLVSAAFESRRLQIRPQPEMADVYILAVPTPFLEETKGADLTYVRDATASILPFLRRGNLVILESTVPPGTTAGVLAPLVRSTGLMPGVDVYLAHCPERVLPGHILAELVQNDRLAGGLTPRCAEEAARLYETFVTGQVIRTDATTAELVKVMENTFRDVNIALSNEFALIAEKVGVNVWEAITLANRHPRVNLLKPGPGVGGHCIAVDPWFLVAAAPAEARLIRLAREVNDSMPGRVLDRLAQLVPPGSTLALLGITYKANVGDTRESPALIVAELAVQRGYQVRLHDPHVRFDEAHLPAPLLPLEQALRGSDALVLLVDHGVFQDLDPGAVGRLVRRRALLDTRAALDLGAWQAAGFRTLLLGSGSTDVASEKHQERG